MLQRLAEGIGPCKLDQINADPKGYWYRLVRKDSSTHHTWIRELKQTWTRGRQERVKIRRGVRQGCCLSLILFNLYTIHLTMEDIEGFEEFKLGGQVIRTV